MTNTQNEPVEVTQADRDVMADAFRDAFNWDESELAAIRRGDRDDRVVVQAFAKHRLSASSAVVDALREDFCRSNVETWHQEWVNAKGGHWGDNIAWASALQIADRLDAALANTPKPNAAVVDALRDERGWLIEIAFAEYIHWVALSDEKWPRTRITNSEVVRKYVSPLRFTKDANEALRFARKEDAAAFAELFSEFILGDYTPTEHIFAALANTPKQSAGLVEELRRYPDWLSTLNNIVRALEDEGDRVYLGSTNDADDLREVARTLDDLSHMFALEGDRP